MSFELIHTSVPRDLDGQSGFGVAAMTRDLPRQLRDALVAWSDGSELDGTNERAISYAICQVGGAAWPVLTCVTRCGVDWSGRANRVAHHLVLEPGDRCIDGPIALARAFAFARVVPEVGVRQAPSLPEPASEQGNPRGVDPAWIDVLAERVSGPDASTVVVRLPAGLDPFVLIAAVTARVEPRRRWAVQWSTAPVFHAGQGFPSIVLARERDAHALDLAQPAPSPRTVVAGQPTGATATGPRTSAVEPIAATAHMSTRERSTASSSPATSHEARPQKAAHEPVAATSVKPWVPIVLFAVAGVMVLVALGLLLW